MLYNLNPKLKQKLEAEGYRPIMLIAIDKLQDNQMTIEQYKGRTKKILESKHFTEEEKNILKKDWFTHAKAIAEFNSLK